MKNLYDIIIVGGGPGGIASAVEASIFGLEKILFIEKGENHSQTIRQYYKDAKRVDKDWQGQSVDMEGNIEFFDGTKESTLEYFELLLDNENIDTVFNCEVDRVVKENDLFTVTTPQGSFTAKNVIVSIGRMGKPNKPSYKIPPSLKQVVNFNPYECRGREKILVVGGGDSAVEYACQLSCDNNVTLSYRRESFNRINDINLEMVERYDQEERLRVRYGIDIDSIENEKGKVKVNYNNGFYTIYDRVIYALGGTTPVDFFRKSNMVLDEHDLPVINEKFETSVKGLYIAGDIVYKSGGSIAMAINHAYHILQDITGEKGGLA
ncbi:NAD(P)-binding domain-containing protein [Sulfurovum sp. zt1-1]|uniref:NAD(P)-binding domain-containing protein n=1 Tax=Sulfurovum zhangzhouensis TaxID=3019067 RepID=A0ABT7QXE6_9BACT|nr:NAD(P)-binding domain-containing protein [Sulfurovum zhangzhouensis]MDM5271505.1 NAD(P)-binding domain-containing protein [Sulfurovum zhangzhouensis]